MEMPIFGTKNVLFGYFLARIIKNYCHNHLQICYKWVFNSHSEFRYRIGFF